MRGTFFQKPLELQLEIEGETWAQGDPIRGTLTIRNRGAEAASSDSIASIRTQLGYGDLKKVWAKAPEAFEILATSDGLSQALAPGGEARLAWEFQTDRNAPITDNTSSLFILCGQTGATERMGQLQLQIKPYPMIEEFVKALEIQNRFVVKSRKASYAKGKAKVEVKFSPPDSKAFANLEQLQVSFHYEGERLALRYQFQVKKVEATAASYDLKKDKLEVKQEFASTDCYTLSGRPDHERIEAAVSEALDTVRSKVLF